MTVLWAIKREVKLRNEPMSNGIGTHRDLVHSQRTGRGPDLRSLGMRFEIEGVISRLTLDHMGRNAVGGPHSSLSLSTPILIARGHEESIKDPFTHEEQAATGGDGRRKAQ